MIQQCFALMCFVSFAAFAQGGPAANASAAANGQSHPCHQIKQACEQAGFAKGQAKQGTGLWADCIKPILTGSSQPKNAAKALPAVDANLIAECKAKHPGFGEGHEKH